jgi:hypothetical protein
MHFFTIFKLCSTTEQMPALVSTGISVAIRRMFRLQDAAQ